MKDLATCCESSIRATTVSEQIKIEISNTEARLKSLTELAELLEKNSDISKVLNLMSTLNIRRY